MSRIPSLPVDQWDPELRAMTQGMSMTPQEKLTSGVMANAPHISKAIGLFLATAMQGRKLSRRLIELVRLRLAFHNQCRSCMAMRYQSALDDGLTEGMVCSLEKPMEAPDLSEREKVALAFTDTFAINHFAIDEKTYTNLQQHFSNAEIVELGMFIGFYLGTGRFAATLDMVDELPKAYQDKSKKVAPWEIKETNLTNA
jgi:AhpD family alkylhydroperoxidase